MNIDEWWPKLDPSAQEWLVANNGDAVSAEVLRQIAAAGGSVTSDSRWVGESDEGGFFLSDEETDWIEAPAPAGAGCPGIRAARKWSSSRPARVQSSSAVMWLCGSAGSTNRAPRAS